MRIANIFNWAKSLIPNLAALYEVYHQTASHKAETGLKVPLLNFSRLSSCNLCKYYIDKYLNLHNANKFQCSR